jgi:hypothetical protein
MRATSRDTRRWGRGLAVLAVVAITAAVAVPGLAQDGQGHGDQAHGGHGQSQALNLIKLQLATLRFHSIDAVERAGYQLGYIAPFLLDQCIVHPTDGAMGFHWFNHDKIHDTTVDPFRPEAMVYAPRSNGSLRLAAVEWVVPKNLWEAEHGVGAAPPTVLGHEMHILNPALGWYVAHAWVWMYNPSGVFADWNPRVDCS